MSSRIPESWTKIWLDPGYPTGNFFDILTNAGFPELDLYNWLQDEEGAPSIGSFAGTKRNRSKVDYAASLNFVSAGIAGKEKVNKSLA